MRLFNEQILREVANPALVGRGVIGNKNKIKNWENRPTNAAKMGDFPNNLSLCIRLADGFTEGANFVQTVAGGPPFVKAGQGKVAGIVAVSGEALAANRTGSTVVVALFYGMVADKVAGAD